MMWTAQQMQIVCRHNEQYVIIMNYWSIFDSINGQYISVLHNNLPVVMLEYSNDKIVLINMHSFWQIEIILFRYRTSKLLAAIMQNFYCSAFWVIYMCVCVFYHLLKCTFLIIRFEDLSKKLWNQIFKEFS